MTKASPLLLAIVLFGTAGVYGCTNQKNDTLNAKIREMETRFAKLEEDYRTVVATSEATRKKLTQAEAQKIALTKEVEELRPVVGERDELRKERDELRKQLVTRTGERDAMQAQLAQFRQELQGLITRVDSVLTTPEANSSVSAVPASRKPE
jgi:outer membrane murein-binding lipoprotein Lpp